MKSIKIKVLDKDLVHNDGIGEALVDVLRSQRQQGTGALLIVETERSSALADALQSPIAWWLLRLAFVFLGLLVSYLMLRQSKLRALLLPDKVSGILHNPGLLLATITGMAGIGAGVLLFTRGMENQVIGAIPSIAGGICLFLGHKDIKSHGFELHHLSILGIAACAIFAEIAIAITLGALVLCVIVALVSP